MKKALIILLTGLFLITACWREIVVTSTPGIATAPQFPTATLNRIFPTSSSPSDTVTWRDLDVTLDNLETTQEYVTDFGSSRVPPSGQKFLWVHVQLKNTGQIEMGIPVFEHYSILYAGTELKPIYGHRQGYVEYTTLGTTIFPDQELDGWLRFDIPAAAELKDLRFVFIPETAQVGASYTSPSYPYADDKPTYVWNCAP